MIRCGRGICRVPVGMVMPLLLLCCSGAAAQAQTSAPLPGAQTTRALADRSASVADAGQTIAGRVVSATDGHPIANANVTLSPQQRNGRPQVAQRGPSPSAQIQTAQTDAEGRYRFPPQPAGRYTLRASAPGYLPSLYLEHDGFSSAVVAGAGVATDNLRFLLLPEASLHGRVLDDTGEPVHASMVLYRDTQDDPGVRSTTLAGDQRIRPAGGAQTDDDGRFEFSDLRPGRYYVAATATPWYAVHARSQGNEDRMPYRTSIDPALDVAYPTVFFPHATTEDGATPIVLKTGQRLTANLLMQAEHAVTLTVQMPATDAGPSSAIQAYPALFRTVFGNEQAAGGQMQGRTADTVTIAGLSPGQYVMRSFGRGGFQPSADVPVNLTGGSNTTALHTSPQGASDVNIALHSASGAALPESAQVELQRMGAPRAPAQAQSNVEQGTAHFHGVEAGFYRIRVQSGGEAWNVSRLTVNDKVVSSRLLRVDGSISKADVLASAYAPEMNGFVHAADGKAHAGSLVVLVPAGADSGEDLFRVDQSNLDGSFQFFNVLPGNYLLVAIDNAWGLNWSESSALMPFLPHALPVTVAASGPRVVTLPEAATVQQK